MREELEAVISELKQLRAEGVTDVYVEEGTLEPLRDYAARARKPERPEGKKAEAMEIPSPPSIDLPEGDKAEKLAALRERVKEDSFARSQLKPGKQIVFGVGAQDADIFFCGEAPGADEETEGEPFVGPAGQLLDKIILAMELQRETVYISNIMTYRPPLPTEYGNRPPNAEEMNYCLPYLKAQIAIVEPKVIIALGKTAVDGLLGPDSKRTMGKVRGQWFEFEGIPLIPTYHPSYLLRNPSKSSKRLVWEDVLAALVKAGLPRPEK